MNIVPTTWEKGCLLEANKFWFYALALSLARCCFDLLSLVFTGSSITTIAVATTTTTPIVIINSNDNEKPKDKEKENENPQQQSPHRTSLSYHSLLKQIIIDGCDLYIPGTMVGWTHATSLQVGFMMAVSTVLAADDIWVKAQRWKGNCEKIQLYVDTRVWGLSDLQSSYPYAIGHNFLASCSIIQGHRPHIPNGCNQSGKYTLLPKFSSILDWIL